MDNKWSNKLRKKMESYEEVPPLDLWKDIERAIQKSPIIVPVTKNRTYWTKRYAALAAVLLFCLTVGYILREEYLVSDKYKIADTIPEHINSNPSIEKEPDIVDLLVSEDVVESRIDEYYQSKITHSSNKEEDYKHEDIQVVEENANNLKEEKTPNQTDGSKLRSKEEKETKKNESNPKPSLLPPKKDSSLKLNLYASNLGSDFENQRRNSPQLLASGAPSLDMGEYPSDEDMLKGSIMENNLYRDVVTNVKHKQPIRFGVSIGFDINHKWSLTSGLTYTKLTSDLFSGSDSYYYTGEQVLHYVGIPIAVRYKILEYSKFSLYTSLEEWWRKMYQVGKLFDIH